MVEATSAVVRVVGGELLAGGDTALLLSWWCGVACELGEPLGTLIGVMPHYTTLIASDGGLVLLVRDGDGVASGSGSGVGVVVVVGGSRRSAVEVVVGVVVAVVVMASWPGVSSTPVLINRTRHLCIGLVGSETSA